MKSIVTHNGGFHADDVFACATLSLVFDKMITITRSRDPEIIKSGDIVLDVGQIYDGVKFFDHHQIGGAGVRENNIPYASFGLIWKYFGLRLVKDEAFKYVDERLVQTVDALDNGYDISPNPKINIFTISDVIGSFNLVGHEGKEEDHKHDEAFFKALEIAREVLQRVIVEAKDFADSMSVFKAAFDLSEDKRLVVLEHHVRKECISKIPEVLYVVHPYHNNTWVIRTTRKNDFSFESRKPLPKDWGGKSEALFQQITGVKDAIFCHRALFLANAKTKESAIALAKLALNS